MCGTPIEVKKSFITRAPDHVGQLVPAVFEICRLVRVSCVVLVFRDVSGTVPHDMETPFVLRPGIGMEKRKIELSAPLNVRDCGYFVRYKFKSVALLLLE
jgi:hypothetical protein